MTITLTTHLNEREEILFKSFHHRIGLSLYFWNYIFRFHFESLFNLFIIILLKNYLFTLELHNYFEFILRVCSTYSNNIEMFNIEKNRYTQRLHILFMWLRLVYFQLPFKKSLFNVLPLSYDVSNFQWIAQHHKFFSSSKYLTMPYTQTSSNIVIPPLVVARTTATNHFVLTVLEWAPTTKVQSEKISIRTRVTAHASRAAYGSRWSSGNSTKATTSFQLVSATKG